MHVDVVIPVAGEFCWLLIMPLAFIKKSSLQDHSQHRYQQNHGIGTNIEFIYT
jgi:hypothetical protein